MKTKMIRINFIKQGDTVVIDGVTKTVCKNDIKHGGFMGSSLFGDSYKLGTILVEVVINWKETK